MSIFNLNINKLAFFVFFLVTFVLCSCHEKKNVVSVSLSDFDTLQISGYDISANRIYSNIRMLSLSDKSICTADIHTRSHYNAGMNLLWITRNGVSAKADTLLNYISRVDSMGFSPEKFYYSLLKNDLQRVRSLDFDTIRIADYSADKVFARLEYYLTKAFLRYTEGQRFGFMNPYKAFNRLDQLTSDTLHVTYRSLFGWHTSLPNEKYIATACSVIKGDMSQFVEFLAQSKPRNPLYYKFITELSHTKNKNLRRRLLCNIERCRWENDGDYPQLHEKYVIVNLPSLCLFAHDKTESLVMKVAIGSLDTKTPLLSSSIKRMDFNPQWIIPKSIVKTSVIHHVGNQAYFDNNNYFVRERSTGKIVEPENVTREMLLSNSYSVVQWGGRGNALGRVVFRFDNNYSIYLHDTSSPKVFSRANRMASHGCIRVEKPYELAVFMLNEKNEQLMEKMKYSMESDYSERPQENVQIVDKQKRSQMVHSLKVEPSVPIYITYYTLYYDSDGNLVSYDDIYGYDGIIYETIKKFL